jgi:hypothetical protein
MEARHLTLSMFESMQHVSSGGDWRSIPVELRPALKPIKNSLDNRYHRSAWVTPARTLACDVRQQPKAHPDELRALSIEEWCAI